MARNVTGLAGMALAAVLVMPIESGAHGPHQDPDPCNGTIGGMHITERTPSPPGIIVPEFGPGVIIPITDPDHGPLYLDVRDVASHSWIVAIYLYQETNGEPGLQRGGLPVHPVHPVHPGLHPRGGGTRTGRLARMTKPSSDAAERHANF